MSTKRRNTGHDLQFNVAQLLKEATGATRHYEFESRAITNLDNEVSIVGPLLGQAQFLRTGRDILVTGTIQTTVEKKCGRCLATFTAPLALEIEEEFHPSIDILTGNEIPASPDEDEANRISEQHILDLLEIVRQRLLLESEVVRYCKPDCKGLCPHCGQDRNVEPCNCADEVIDMRWAGLLALELEE